MKNWHYFKNFGVAFDVHATIYDTELSKSLTHESLKRTLEIIKPDWIHGDCKGHMGLTSWPSEIAKMPKGVVKDGLRIYRDVCRELNIPLVVHFTGLWDRQTLLDHPEWVAVGPKGEPYSDEGYDWMPVPACPNSPFWDEMMIPNMLEAVEKYDLDGFWIDGDTWANKLCYCHKCKAEFKAKYGFDAPIYKEQKSDFVGFVKKQDYSKNYDCSFEDWMKWINFHREKYLQNVKKYVDAVHNKKPSCTITTNWLHCFGLTLDRPYKMDYLSGDEQLCTKNAMVNGHFYNSLGMDWDISSWSMQNDDKHSNFDTKSLCQYKQDFAYIMACGGACMGNHQPSRTGLVNDFVAKLYGKLGEFVRHRAPFVRHSKSIPQIAVLVSPDDINEQNGDMLIGPNAVHPQFDKIYGLVNLLTGSHYQYDIFYPDMIGNYDDYEIIMVTGQHRFSDDIMDKLKAYVEIGGKLLVEGIDAIEKFSELLGVEVIGEEIVNEFITPPWQKNIYIPINDEIATSECDYMKVKVKSAKAIKPFMNGLIVGENETPYPAVTLNEFGKGKTIGINFDMYEQYYSSFFKRYREIFQYAVELLEPSFIIQDVKAPHYAHLVLKEKEGNLLISCLNQGSIVVNNTKSIFSEDLPEIEKISFKVKTDKPEKVELIPDNSRLSYFYKDGFLNVEIRNLDFMDIVRVSP